MNSSSVPAWASQPRSARRASWRAQDLARRGDDRRAVLPLDVGQAQRGALVPRRAAQRVEVGLEHEVAVAALPARHRVAVDGVHVDVDGEQVVAALGAVADHRLQETARGQALALQAPLHVGQRQQDGVDVACRDLGLQLVEGHGCATVPCRGASVANMVGPAHQCPSSPPSSPAWSPSSARWRASRSRSTAASPTATTACGWAARTSSLRLCDHGAEVLGIDRSDGGDRLAPRRRARASPRRSSPSCATCRRSSRAGCRAATSPPSSCARPGVWRRSPRMLRRLHDHAGAAERVRDLPARRASSARSPARVPDSYDRLAGPARTASRRRSTGPEHVPVSCHNDLLTANFLRDGARRVHRRLGVRRDERPLLRPRQPRRSTTSFDDERRRARCSSLLRRAGDRARGFAALQLMRVDLRLPRGDVGRRAARRSELDFDFAGYASEHFERLERAAADPRVEEWLARCRDRVSCPSARAS